MTSIPPRRARGTIRRVREHPKTAIQAGIVEGCCKALLDMHKKGYVPDEAALGEMVGKNPLLAGSLSKINRWGAEEKLLKKPITHEEFTRLLYRMMRAQGRKKPK